MLGPSSARLAMNLAAGTETSARVTVTVSISLSKTVWVVEWYGSRSNNISGAGIIQQPAPKKPSVHQKKTCHGTTMLRKDNRHDDVVP